MIEYEFSLVFVGIIGYCQCATIQTLKSINDNLIPLIIGISLMAFVIIILLASLCVCFVIRKNTKDEKGSYNVVNQIPEQVKLVDFTLKKSSALYDAHNDLPLPKSDKKVTLVKPEVKLPIKSSLQFSKIHRYRRASVPATLTTLHEASPSLEASSRKMSLSYNCVLEPQHDSKRNTILLLDDGAMVIPESGPATEIHSRQDSTDKPSEPVVKKYSIYDDEDLFLMQDVSRYGQIVFSLQYDLNTKTLEVTVSHAKYLLGHGTKRKNHYYVKLLLRTKACPQYMSTTSLSGVPDKGITKPNKNIKGTFRTSIKSDFCHPTFDESFKFTNVTAAVLRECVLQFIVKEETPKFLEKNIIIGCVDFFLDEAELIEKHESITEIVRDIQPVGQIEDKGKVVLSLQFNRSLATLSVSVMEIISGSEQLVDVSVELFLRTIDSIIVSKKFELDGDLKSNHIENFSFDACLLGSLCLVLVFFSRIRNCSKTPFGRLIVGPIQFASGARLAHWTEMSSGKKVSIKTHEII